MCPACVTTLALASGGTAAAGGIVTLAVRKLRQHGKQLHPLPKEKKHEH